MYTNLGRDFLAGDWPADALAPLEAARDMCEALMAGQLDNPTIHDLLTRIQHDIGKVASPKSLDVPAPDQTVPLGLVELVHQVESHSAVDFHR